MTHPALDPSTETGRAARWTIMALAAAQTLFWIYAIYHIVSHANPKGDGFELVAIMPMSFIFFGLALPAWMLAREGRKVGIAAILCLAGLLANALLWAEILSELAH